MALAPPFGRVVTAMVTPFGADGELDVAGTRKLVSYLTEHGTETVVVSGTTGESPTLEDDEKFALIEAAVEAASGRAKVMAGTSTYDTRHSVKLTRRACALGVDGILAVTPYYNRPGQAGIAAHFRAIADASEVPVMLYNIPSRTGRRIELDTLVELASHPRIVAVKDAVGDIAFTSRTVRETPEDFHVYSGDDAVTLPMLAVGGVGVVSVASHLVGGAIKTMIEAFESGDHAGARSLHLRLMDLFDALFVEPNPIPLKAVLSKVGLPAGQPRLPLTPATEATQKRLQDALEAVSDLLDAALPSG